MNRRFKRLQFVLEKSAVYSKILKARMEEDRQKQQRAKVAQAEVRATRTCFKQSAKSGPAGRTGKKRFRAVDGGSEDEREQEGCGPRKRVKGSSGEAVVAMLEDGGVGDDEEEEDDEPPIYDQPTLVTGAKLKNYQLEGLQWMVSLDQNGISGILADEMGLGKTLQVIAFSAYLREHHNYKPFLVVCPLSVLHNWIDEYQKFAPQISVCMYHGTPAERAELRETVMALPTTRQESHIKKSNKTKVSASVKSKGKSTVNRSKAGSQSRINNTRKTQTTLSYGSQKGTPLVDDDGKVPDEDNENFMKQFPVVVTTYEIIMKDRMALAGYQWGYIVVDEGHRLKNMDCKLMKEIKKYQSAGRMILTGTPLHNNLAELWSLLNFVLPDIFDDVDAFQEWFNLPMMQTLLGSTRSTQLITSLHAILKPFLLRRMKGDVEMNLPPKKEYVIYAPLTVRQREAYECVLEGRMREWLIAGGVANRGDGKVAKDKPMVEKEKEGKENGKRRIRSEKRAKKRYADIDGDDDAYFDMVGRGEVDERGALRTKGDGGQGKEEKLEEIGREYQYKSTLKQVNNMRLQNTVMQLRKVCSHPFLFDWPLDPKTLEPVLGKELVHASGKMMVLDRLLRELFRRGHRVLLFSQFTTMLDIIETWATDYMKWPVCRIDGSTPPEERRAEMNRFQEAARGVEDGPRLFLLSTRAGGLGINLVAADTVIFYDQDWNPQMDVQAQDRAHRIGQKKPVLIFRLVSAHTIETKIMHRATEKRKLEALVIAKGKFKKPAAAAGVNGVNAAKSMAEVAAALLRLEADKIEVVPPPSEGGEGGYVVLSDEELDILLDRRPEVFTQRGRGWTNVGQRGEEEEVLMEDKEDEKEKEEVERVVGVSGKRAAFAVYEAPKDVGNDALARMLGEDVE
ncbi:hypothetical protein AMATHDRAFT_68199 [Amanita thiersii Skay4041]|uniref:Helicase ATP-binding domain-containing protein n=1 Tax=Amanita thiersii Skay4041 TaxID=703135 RepID=A0A2A9NAX6_9AGAR|nr:hypothetical protein AMATHDRAFT_68199 [Amanita thiersii Skay4041]